MDDNLTVLKCWHCQNWPKNCWSCAGTGNVFWVNGRTYPYTMEGEKRARISAAAPQPEKDAEV